MIGGQQRKRETMHMAIGDDGGALVPRDTGDAPVPDDIASAAVQDAAAQHVAPRDHQPAWSDKFVWQSLWKVVAVGLSTFFFLTIGWRIQTLLREIAVAFFFALAMIPAVKWIHERWGWKRGAAVGAIYGGLILFVALMVLVLIPAISNFANEVSTSGVDYADEINSYSQDLIGQDLVSQESGADAGDAAGAAMSKWSDNIVGAVETGIGLLFTMATILLFTFYFAADAPRVERALLSRMPPHRQKVVGWIWDTAIEQTGGYFYSRMLLVIINGGLFFIAMLLVGMPLVYALPLSIFEGFVAEFIPAIGTYLGAAVPILITLVVQGLVPALILLVWVLIYQQAENYWLSPRISAGTMEINGGVAFGAALAGGAIAGPMGAFVALPVAALITSIIKNAGKTYDVVYQSAYESADDHPDALSAPGDA
jgi:predicted PurR-regulated permease PerM